MPSLTNIFSLVSIFGGHLPLPLLSPRFSPCVNFPADEPAFLSPLSHPLCHAVLLLLYLCCLFLSPAVSLSGLGVGFGDSVLWILPWLRPKLLRPTALLPHQAHYPAHPFFLLVYSPNLFPTVSCFLSIQVTCCSEETPSDSPSTVTYGQACSLPSFQS